MNDFDFVAPFYDLLKLMVFGKELEIASQYHFDQIQPGSNILLLGGGTGACLEALPDCSVVYVEKSKKMLSRAQSRRTNAKISFVHEDFVKWESQSAFDFVICPFFLDVFRENDLDIVIHKIKGMTRPTGKVIVTDFEVGGGASQQLLLGAMHAFFRIFSRLDSIKLKDLKEKLFENGFTTYKRKTFRKGSIWSLVLILPC